MRCRIDGSLLRLILQTKAFSLYTCVASAHSVRVGAPATNTCLYGYCTAPRVAGLGFCDRHRAALRVRSRRRKPE